MGACGSTAPRSEAPAAPADPIAALEDAVLDEARTARVHVETEGAIEAQMDGTLVLAANGDVTMRFDGTFGGEPKAPWLEMADGRMRGGSVANEAAFDEAAPPEARDAIVVGLVRMGLMHNLARLSFDQPPDHADGGVREWVRASDVRESEGRLDFVVVVAGEPAGEATLYAEDGLPVRREQTVHFDEGDMRVVEEVRWR